MPVEISELWNSLSRTLFANVDEDFVNNFRRPGGANGRLGSWDPFDRSMRYFKFMLYAAAERQPERFFKLYRALGRVDIGSPVSITVQGCAVNIDYLLALEEYLFLEAALAMKSVRSVIEIGAGFGRTCHTLLALAGDSIEQYTIVDLENVLALSRRVLAEAVPQHWPKIRFVAADDVSGWHGCSADLAINIDSFQEMPPATIDAYMDGIVRGCRHLYVKNPVAKYHPACIGIEVRDPAELHDAFALGYCRDVIDIFDDRALGAARRTYLEAYRPGRAWSLLAERPAAMFPYYHHALYRAP